MIKGQETKSHEERLKEFRIFKREMIVVFKKLNGCHTKESQDLFYIVCKKLPNNQMQFDNGSNYSDR